MNHPSPAACFGGVVVGGDKRGRLLGFPTANVAPSAGSLIPADGVYACWVSFPPEPALHGATVSIGNNPTFGDVSERRIEAFVHDFSANLYGCPVSVRIVEHIRNMECFDSLDELISATAEDVRRSRARLAA
jgi:riboflavin kinase